MASWLLPEGISDVLPEEARRVEGLRRALLDLYASYGYEFVIPPLIEYLDSLLTGTGRDLDLRTFKFVDQLSGRQLGLRADITPQTARIDAHILNRSGVVRLCYAGSVLHTRPAHPLATRQPIQVGAELYGHAGLAADAEIQQLAVASLRRAGVQRVVLDLGHTAIVRALLADVPPPIAEQIIDALAAKDAPALRAAARVAPPATAAAVEALTHLHGDVRVIDEARRLLPSQPIIVRALDDLARLAEISDADEVGIDLADLHGYRYYTGVNFAAYEPRVAGALLRGGRYDDIGRAFGRARPATGFSVDLRDLVRLHEGDPAPLPIVAPADDDPALAQAVAALRANGAVVVRQLAPDEPLPALARRLCRIDGRWQVVDQD
ncbi:MAG: ATP phosphoribosyltransferase regulatory subunit [Sutterellaceae bacterium]|nr:ATP phosphoribosyltransferase regulatory subunit [Burkholderiaceae bacterium]MCX7900783.1 ATP phosphoribosyltransferase regulatory subunit [Burkholderiaceae bacterium]MDW8429071.1 ATP phosphoribosyltransferase regulatory subunit [Sutterellaceae bacterium]